MKKIIGAAIFTIIMGIISIPTYEGGQQGWSAYSHTTYTQIDSIASILSYIGIALTVILIINYIDRNTKASQQKQDQ